MNRHTLFLFTLCTCLAHVGYSQDSSSTRIVRVVDALTLYPVSFVHFTWLNGGPDGISDANGRIIVPNELFHYKQLKISKYQYRDYYANTDTWEDTIRFLRYKHLEYSPFTLPQTDTFIQEVINSRTVHDPYNMGKHTTETYQKLSFGSSKPAALDQFARTKLRFLRIDWPEYKNPYRLIFMENAGKKEVLSHRLHYEVIRSANISGVHQAGALGLPAYWQPFSMYEDEVIIAGSSYAGVLHPRTRLLYAFSIEDTLFTDSMSLVLVKFNPLPSVNLYEKLEGMLWIDLKTKAVVFASAMPALKTRNQISLHFEARKIGYDLWYPYRTLTRFDMPSIGREPIPLDAENWQYYGTPFFTDKPFSKEGYEIAVDFKADEENGINNTVRKESLTEAETGTLDFYNRLGDFQNLSSYLFIGQRLISGYIPVGKIDIALNRIFVINDYEGVRLGAGFQTNRKFSERMETGGFLGYGLQDNGLKGGAFFKILEQTGSHTPLHLAVSSNIEEPAMPQFYFYQRQHASEALRGFRLTTFDRVNSISAGSAFHPFLYTDVYGGFKYNEVRPLYDYQFKSEESPTLEWSEFEMEVRYTFGLRYLRFQQERIQLRNRYPVVYFRFTGSVNPSQSVDYQAFHLRIVHSIKLMGFATIHNQLRTGYIRGNAPYTRLFSGTGGFREISTVSHNSFETMLYNEYLMNRYVVLHTSFHFGRLPMAYNRTWTSPELEWLHSMGWGKLDHPEHHIGIRTEDIRKVYLETGLNLSNILIIPVSGLKVGLGAGIFARYGPYALPKPSDNLVGKVSLLISL